MKKRDLVEALAPLGDDDEVVLALITPKDEDEDGFDLGTEGNAEPDEDDDTVDNEDGTVTTFEAIDDVQVLENEDPDNNNAKEKFGAIIIDMAGGDEDDEADDDNSASEGDNAPVSE